MRFIKITCIIIFITFLSSCNAFKSYDELYDHYQGYLEENHELYQDMVDSFNNVSNQVIESVVMIEVSRTGSDRIIRGSGVVIGMDETSYYVITNHHVVHTDGSVPQTYAAFDYLEVKYVAQLVTSSPSYDLAVLSIPRLSTELSIITIREDEPLEKTEISILGYPSARTIAITKGYIMYYMPIDITDVGMDVIDLDFDVMVSSAPVKSGSSGSLVIDSNLELVGIVYAGYFSEDTSIPELTFAIPTDKIHEFLIINQIKVGDYS